MSCKKTSKQPKINKNPKALAQKRRHKEPLSSYSPRQRRKLLSLHAAPKTTQASFDRTATGIEMNLVLELPGNKR